MITTTNWSLACNSSDVLSIVIRHTLTGFCRFVSANVQMLLPSLVGSTAHHRPSDAAETRRQDDRAGGSPGADERD